MTQSSTCPGSLVANVSMPGEKLAMARKAKNHSGLEKELPVHIGEGSDNLLTKAVKLSEIDSKARPLGRAFIAYAAPNFWGPKVTVASPIGSVTYTIACEGVGDTLCLVG